MVATVRYFLTSVTEDVSFDKACFHLFQYLSVDLKTVIGFSFTSTPLYYSNIACSVIY